jgi:hypothetical protein
LEELIIILKEYIQKSILCKLNQHFGNVNILYCNKEFKKLRAINLAKMESVYGKSDGKREESRTSE